MSTRILITFRAVRDQLEIARWIVVESPAAADRWLDASHDAIKTLAEFPLRCPIAKESSEHREETRQLLFGEYRILFTVDGDAVVILHVRHSARQAREDPE